MKQIDIRRALVKKVKAGNATRSEEQELADIFRKLYRPHRVTNYLYDADEMYAAYLLAAWNAVYRTKLTIGDPVMFCVRRGRGAMLDFYRTESKLRLLLVCQSCLSEWPYDRPYIKEPCRHCGHTEMRSFERTVHSRLSLERASAHHSPVDPAGAYDSQEEENILTLINPINKQTKISLKRKDLFDFLVSLVDEEIAHPSPRLDPLMLQVAKSALLHRVPFRDEAVLQFGKSSAWSVYAEGVIGRFLADRTHSLPVEAGGKHKT